MSEESNTIETIKPIEPKVSSINQMATPEKSQAPNNSDLTNPSTERMNSLRRQKVNCN